MCAVPAIRLILPVYFLSQVYWMRCGYTWHSCCWLSLIFRCYSSAALAEPAGSPILETPGFSRPVLKLTGICTGLLTGKCAKVVVNKIQQTPAAQIGSPPAPSTSSRPITHRPTAHLPQQGQHIHSQARCQPTCRRLRASWFSCISRHRLAW